ncbi:hypothetical protein ACQPZX_12680 [Actinoplanes sp. CA-142083]|uniref:hypothetical protein n=1 Tax=Actinoplanes sp. CA-142083 TaxID=3239903 RepID=UPI003D8E1EC3
MTQRPVWLRREPAYRAYIRGLRYTLLAGLSMLVVGLLGVTRLIPPALTRGLMIACFLVVCLSTLIGGVGWLLVPDKRRANLHQFAFLAMVGHDVFKGMPRDKQPQNGVVVR